MSQQLVSQRPSGDLQSYFEQVRQFPMLTAEEERELAERWRATGDPEAARCLLGSHLRLVIKIARSFKGYGLPLADLIAEGNVGLMQALAKFEPERGYRFATYAMWWIRAAMQEYILHNWSLVKMGTTAAQKKLFFNLRKLKGRLQAVELGDLGPEAVEEIARRLDVTESEVIEMNRRLEGADHSLNAVLRADGDTEWQDRLVDERADQESVVAEANELEHRRSLMNRAMGALNERERHILVERRLKDDPMTLEDLSRIYGVSRERVRQIEVRAFEKLRKAMLEIAANDAGGPRRLAA